MSWAKLLQRVFKIDVTQCLYCKGEVRVVAAILAAILERTAVQQILTHLGLPAELPKITPARAPPQLEMDDFYPPSHQDFNDF